MLCFKGYGYFVFPEKIFSDSAFYNDPEHKYPTIEEQVKMARRVAMSLTAPANKQARGHRMFMKRLMKSEKWSTDPEGTAGHFIYDTDQDEEKYYNPDPWATKSHNPWAPTLAGQVPTTHPSTGFIPPAPPLPAPPPPAPVFAAPVLLTELQEDKKKALSADEFERMRLYEKKTDHTNVSPAVCFSLAEDLRNMKGKGGKLFAKRVAKSEKWVVDEPSPQSTGPNPNVLQKLALQAAESGGPMPFNPLAPPPQKGAKPGEGPVVNRLKEMIDPPKPKMTPWDAMAEYGHVGKAFEHLDGYMPYGRSEKGKLADSLGSAATRGLEDTPDYSSGGGPVSGQPAKMPEFSSKIKPWGAESASQGMAPAAGWY